MDDVVAAAVAGGVVTMLATAMWIDSQNAVAGRDLRAMRAELRSLRNEVARHLPRMHASGSSMHGRMDDPPGPPDWFAPHYPTLLRFRERTVSAPGPVPDAPTGPAG